MKTVIPVVLFAYARPEHLRRTLTCLQSNHVPMIYAFADGPKNLDVESRVSATRHVLHEVDWCEIQIIEREKNLGLGSSILTGVSEIFQKHDALIVFEDDLVCAPGTYQFLCAALEHYKEDPKVMSVTGWTHPRVTPSTVTNQPYFDGRTESWSWGTWARVWKDMDRDAMTLVNSCVENKIDIYRYGADLFEMAKVEKEKNIWAVRFSYLHILQGGLCLRPPRSLVDHAGFDEYGTNAVSHSKWALNALDEFFSIPQTWPPPIENTECAELWQRECGSQPTQGEVSPSSWMQSAKKKVEYFFSKLGRSWTHS